MQLSDEQRTAMQQAIEAVKGLNNALYHLRNLDIGCNIRESPDGTQWLLDAKVTIKREHYT